MSEGYEVTSSILNQSLNFIVLDSFFFPSERIYDLPQFKENADDLLGIHPRGKKLLALSATDTVPELKKSNPVKIRIHGTHVYMAITYSKGKDQPGKAGNPARGQLNRENEFLSCPSSRLRT